MREKVKLIRDDVRTRVMLHAQAIKNGRGGGGYNISHKFVNIFFSISLNIIFDWLRKLLFYYAHFSESLFCIASAHYTVQ